MSTPNFICSSSHTFSIPPPLPLCTTTVHITGSSLFGPSHEKIEAASSIHNAYELQHQNTFFIQCVMCAEEEKWYTVKWNSVKFRLSFQEQEYTGEQERKRYSTDVLHYVVHMYLRLYIMSDIDQ